MLPDMDVMNCRNLAVPMGVMQHVVGVESSFNRYAIGVVGGRLVRQPASLPEALATARMLRERGFNFSLGLAQVNRYNLARYGLSFERAFEACPNLQAGARILADCQRRSGNDWGKSLSCYYSGNFVTGFRHGYVQKVLASMRSPIATGTRFPAGAIPVVPSSQEPGSRPPTDPRADRSTPTLVARRIAFAPTQQGPALHALATSPASPEFSIVAAARMPPFASASDETPSSGIDQAFVF